MIIPNIRFLIVNQNHFPKRNFVCKIYYCSGLFHINLDYTGRFIRGSEPLLSGKVWRNKLKDLFILYRFYRYVVLVLSFSGLFIAVSYFHFYLKIQNLCFCICFKAPIATQATSQWKEAPVFRPFCKPLAHSTCLSSPYSQHIWFTQFEVTALFNVFTCQFHYVLSLFVRIKLQYNANILHPFIRSVSIITIGHTSQMQSFIFQYLK